MNPQPYREPAETEPIHIERAPRDPGDYVLAFVCACIVFGIAAVVYKMATYAPPPPVPCSAMGEVPAKDLPARCTKTYDPGAP